MKRHIIILVAVTGIVTSTLAQQALDPAQEHIRKQLQGLSAAPDQSADLPTFDLDFPGGTPQQLVEAIRKQIGKLNAIIPSEHKNVQLPPMKMQEVNVKQLFQALENASYKSVKRGQTVHSFRSGFQSVGPITPESVWYFFAPNIESDDQPNIVRYYQLGRFLKEYKIEDITTAIQAGWKMLGEENPPKLNFHEDTKLLIAVGPIDKLELIHSVLQELERGLHPDSRGYGPPRPLPAPTLPSQAQ